MASTVREHVAVILVAAVCVSCSAHSNNLAGWDPVAVSRNGHALRIVGTFTNLRVANEGVFGAEVRIAVADSPDYQAVVQFGAGQVCRPAKPGDRACFGLSKLHVVEAVFDWTRPDRRRIAHVSFDVTDAGLYTGRFEGVVSDEALTGTFTLPDGKSWHLSMPRGVPFYER